MQNLQYRSLGLICLRDTAKLDSMPRPKHQLGTRTTHRGLFSPLGGISSPNPLTRPRAHHRLMAPDALQLSALCHIDTLMER
jgi:hypothetical protein